MYQYTRLIPRTLLSKYSSRLQFHGVVYNHSDPESAFHVARQDHMSGLFPDVDLALAVLLSPGGRSRCLLSLPPLLGTMRWLGLLGTLHRAIMSSGAWARFPSYQGPWSRAGLHKTWTRYHQIKDTHRRWARPQYWRCLVC